MKSSIRSGKTIYDRSNASQLVGKATRTIVNNRPEAAVQRKLQECINYNTQYKQPVLQMGGIGRASKKRDKDRSKTIKANWSTLKSDADKVRNLISDTEGKLNLKVLNTKFQALWYGKNHSFTDSIQELGGEIYNIINSMSNLSIANKSELELKKQMNAEEADLHRQEITNFSNRINTIQGQINTYRIQISSWNRIASNLSNLVAKAMENNEALEKLKDKINHDNKDSDNIEKHIERSQEKLRGIALLFRQPILDENYLRSRLEETINFQPKFSQITSKNLMKLRASNSDAASETIAILIKEGKVDTSRMSGVYRTSFDKKEDALSIAWQLSTADKIDSRIKESMSWLTSWELHAHCKLLRDIFGDIVGFSIIPGAIHIKPTLKQRDLGISISITNQSFINNIENSYRDELKQWTDDNKRSVRYQLKYFDQI